MVKIGLGKIHYFPSLWLETSIFEVYNMMCLCSYEGMS